MPPQGIWNGDLVLFAHGYVVYNEPLAIPEEQLTFKDGSSIPELVNGLGYAFATTSYSVNGLAVKEGIVELIDLVDIFGQAHGQPDRVYLAGASEGGLITALAVENYPSIFDGGLSTCGPVGDFARQINYWGDVRVLFDYWFPGVIPGSAVSIPQVVIDDWETAYKNQIEAALLADPHATEQLLTVAGVPVDFSNPDSGVDALLGALWYNVFATNDGVAKFSGQPFDNRHRFYFGPDDDWHLNQNVARFQAELGALTEITIHYQTLGDIDVLLVTLHTFGDPIVPYWHEPLYTQKIVAHGDGPLHINVPSLNYGHCNFGAAEVLLNLFPKSADRGQILKGKRL